MKDIKYIGTKPLGLCGEQAVMDELAFHRNFLGLKPCYKGLTHYLANKAEEKLLRRKQPVNYEFSEAEQNRGTDIIEEFADGTKVTYDAKCQSEKYRNNCCFEMYQYDDGWLDFGYNEAKYNAQVFEHDGWVGIFNAYSIVNYVANMNKLPARYRPRFNKRAKWLYVNGQKVQQVNVLFDRERIAELEFYKWAVVACEQGVAKYEEDGKEVKLKWFW